jgi:hypothetical protein
MERIFWVVENNWLKFISNLLYIRIRYENFICLSQIYYIVEIIYIFEIRYIQWHLFDFYLYTKFEIIID